MRTKETTPRQYGLVGVSEQEQVAIVKLANLLHTKYQPNTLNLSDDELSELRRMLLDQQTMIANAMHKHGFDWRDRFIRVRTLAAKVGAPVLPDEALPEKGGQPHADGVAIGG